MKRKDLELRIEELRKKREALVDQLADTDVTSATLSSGGGSKSYTNRSVEDLKRKINFIDREIARIEGLLGLRTPPSAIRSIHPRYVR